MRGQSVPPCRASVYAVLCGGAFGICGGQTRRSAPTAEQEELRINDNSNFLSLPADETGKVTAYFAFPVNIYKNSVWGSLEAPFIVSAESMIMATVMDDEGNPTVQYEVDFTSAVGKELKAGSLIKVVRGEEAIQRYIEDASEAIVTLEQESYTYDGTEKRPAVTVELYSELVEGQDYTVSYSNNVEVGTATVTVTFMGNYSGTITKEFEINNGETDTPE